MGGESGLPAMSKGIKTQQAVVATSKMQPKKLQRLRGRLARRQVINLVAATARATLDRLEQRIHAMHGYRLRHPRCSVSWVDCQIIANQEGPNFSG